ncbi:hypothetical protein [Streptomyces sp. NPDC002588]|uniref:hypothetical protein n=1 Tax=Streptomyces sp. NPDC002588 TaxID=3154419 RepID=UPI0033283450
MTKVAGAGSDIFAAPRTARTVLRLHRIALVVWGLSVVVLCARLVWLAEVTAKEERKALDACGASQDWCDPTMAGMPGYEAGIGWTGWLISHAFLAVAAFAGGALIGRELENGTAHLAWTQGVTPARWLTAKLAVPALAVTAGATVLVLVYRWAARDDRDPMYDPWSGDAFVSRGPAVAAYALCALAVGALAALLVRRALPALAVSVTATGLLGFALARYRGSLWPTVTATSRSEDVDRPFTAWETESGAVVHGRRVPYFDAFGCDGPRARMRACLDDLGVSRFYVTYHPESHYRPIHLVETGVVLAVAALAALAAYWLLRRRTA